MNRFVALSRPLAAATRVQAARSVLATRSAVQSKHTLPFFSFSGNRIFVFSGRNPFLNEGNEQQAFHSPTLKTDEKVKGDTIALQVNDLLVQD